MDKKLLIIIIIALILIVGVSALYYFYIFQKPAPEITPLEEEKKGLGGELLEKAQNPGQKVPETNPFEEVELDLLRGTNPFEGLYKNPFE